MSDLDLLADEPGTKPTVLVAIPYRWVSFWIWVLLFLTILMPGFLQNFRSLAALLLQILVFITYALLGSLYWMRGPAFAVTKEGIKLSSPARVAPGRSRRDPWAVGFYSWDEVTYCRWSPYNPGQLSVHLGAIAHESVGFFGLGRSTIQLPPTIAFYPVPSKYRDAVESAIRACGKWIDMPSPPDSHL